MGLDVVVASLGPWSVVSLLDALDKKGLPAQIVMVDGGLAMPRAEPPATWTDLRLKTSAGMLSLKRRPEGIAIVVFGNADDALQNAQRLIAEVIGML